VSKKDIQKILVSIDRKQNTSNGMGGIRKPNGTRLVVAKGHTAPLRQAVLRNIRIPARAALPQAPGRGDAVSGDFESEPRGPHAAGSDSLDDRVDSGHQGRVCGMRSQSRDHFI
jgi:hypothetical protein